VADQIQRSAQELKTGTLYIVATPIGNLEDITRRAERILKEADVIAAEDTRHTLKLLNHLGIRKPMVSYWGEKEKARAEDVLRHLKTGDDVALVSDAGTPGISDPGAVLVRRALEEGIEVVPIPGPSALAAALSVSGMPTEEFTFLGFLPARSGPRKRALEALALEPRTLVFYESPHRIIDTLIDMEAVLGERRVALARELTKMHEEMIRGPLAEILDRFEESDEPLVGEFVVMVQGRQKDKEMGLEEAAAEVAALMQKGMGRKEAVKNVAKQYGLSKNELYARSLEG
jgi:16S rRNA (cytidine1402-2'-O)-methyltransferase